MSNELTTMGNELVLSPLPGGKAVEIINAPLRLIAPALRVAAQCRPELDELSEKKNRIVRTNEMLRRKHDEVYHVIDTKWGGKRASSHEASSAFSGLVRLEEAKLTREMLLPRVVEVRQAFDVLSTICDGGQNIDAPTALKMLSVLQRVLIKKKDDPVTLMAFAGLFDQEIDDLGVSLSLWKEVPRHPVVVALAIHRLFHKQVFAPAPAELCDACRTVANRLDNKRRNVGSWLGAFTEADIDLFKRDPDAWASIYTTPESLAAGAAFAGLHSPSEGEAFKELRWRRDAAIREMREGGS